MTATTLICPHCGSRLTVSAAAPKVVTCPRCLYRLVNPIGREAGASPGDTPRPGSPQAPLRVLPLEGQASADTNAVNIALIVMVVLLAVGAFISAAAVGVSSAIFNALIVVLMLAFVAVVIVTSYRKQRHDLQVAKAIEQMPPPLAGHEREALSYFAPPPREPSNPLAAAGGFFSAIGMCAAGFVILAATSGFTGSRGGSSATARGERTFFLLFVVAIAVGYMMGAPVLSRRKGWKGFRTGAIIGLWLGMLALGPCAFCYLLTLGA